MFVILVLRCVFIQGTEDTTTEINATHFYASHPGPPVNTPHTFLTESPSPVKVSTILSRCAFDRNVLQVVTVFRVYVLMRILGLRCRQ